MTGRSDDHQLPRDSVEPNVETKAMMECGDCEAIFLRSEARMWAKTRLICPECDSDAIRSRTDRTDHAGSDVPE
jgi:Zn finger protein HypA/HybF involved in hydrogenase expression